MPTSSHHHPNPSSKRPATIAELAEIALDGLWDESRELKHYLRIAEKYRREGKSAAEKGDLELAFVHFAKAATLVLEKLPNHRDYKSVLNSEQRQNLSLNGQDILDNLGNLKGVLVERYDQWKQRHPNEPENPPPSKDNRQRSTAADDLASRYSQLSIQDGNQPRGNGVLEDRRNGGDDAWLQRDVGERDRASHISSERRQAAVAAARQAATLRHNPSGPDYTFSRGGGPPPPNSGGGGGGAADFQAQQEEFRKREEEIVRKRAEQKRKQEQDGILRRQHEAESAARVARQTIASVNPNVGPPGPSSGIGLGSSSTSVLYQPPTRSLTPTPGPNTYYQQQPSGHIQTTSLGGSYSEIPPRLPLESPTRYEGDSTDSESVHNLDWRRVKQRQVMDQNRTPTRPHRTNSYPPPITTTSPPPPETGLIQYPMLMSQHQKRQGYQPSLHSMFASGPGGPLTNNNYNMPSLLLFGAENKGIPPSQGLYSTDNLPHPSMPLPQPPTSYPYGPGPSLPHPPPQHSSSYPPPQHSQIQQQAYPGPTRPAPPVPAPPPPPPPSTSTSTTSTSNSTTSITSTSNTTSSSSSATTLSRSDSERIIRKPNDPSPTLKTVTLPRECLARFLAIAKVNTEMNRETCGLLLGKDRGNKFGVTTLLIPKQHSTSDTCTMDEEELVLQFTEERSLITLGWIHTHPSQSCFMSSVDLHTHSGFQRMLPESFAVVCAPKSNPAFGIFRLTDPPGLQTVLECTAKEAFHPHPDVPIYTDADKGHVQMKDGNLEIVDLR
ncbi:Mov34-domain-containing protein [Pluteus cervinus]|uniref:Mov34-domain-containing protein n=1 Tax=Pluteus cervinus TaxID=181527 RepID=A0ACD3AH93_9AGAR|nr:Mov34-domain-containing protein [Pluteus cervinus]